MRNINISILGNCQIESWRRSLSALYAEVNIVASIPVSSSNDLRRLEDSVFDNSDYIILIESLKSDFEEGLDSLDTKKLQKIVGVPSIFFRGFHPDSTYVYSQHGPVRSGLGKRGEWISSLVWFAYQNRIEPDELQALICHTVFRDMGYMNVYREDSEILKSEFELYGFDFEKWINPMVQMGRFMHGMNHPKISAIGLLAQQMMTRFNFAPTHSALFLDDAHIDPLSDVIWPTFAPIAENLGVKAFPFFTMNEKLYSISEYAKLSYSKWDLEDQSGKSFEMVPNSFQLTNYWKVT